MAQKIEQISNKQMEDQEIDDLLQEFSNCSDSPPGSPKSGEDSTPVKDKKALSLNSTPQTPKGVGSPRWETWSPPSSPDGSEDSFPDSPSSKGAAERFNEAGEKIEQIETFHCYDCHSLDSIKNIRGTRVCTNCGVVKGTEISHELECQFAGMAVGDNSAPSRTGLINNNLLFQSNFSTKIVGNRSSYNIRRMNNVWENLVHRERTLYGIFKKITEKCKQHGIPNNVINYAQVLYKQVYEKQKALKKGNRGSRADKLEGLIAGCIYFSCKLHDINRSHQEIAEICEIEKKDVSTGSKLFFKLMNREVNLNQNTTTYKDFLERYGSHLELDTGELELVQEVCENIYSKDILDDNKPWTIASVCIYFTSEIYDFQLDRKDIAEKCETTEATLKKHFNILLQRVDEVIV